MDAQDRFVRDSLAEMKRNIKARKNLWNVELDEFAMLIRQYAIADDATLTQDAKELKQMLLAAIQPALEAQHRKTWAMAMEEAASIVWAIYPGKTEELNRLVMRKMREAPCPPLTNESKEG